MVDLQLVTSALPVQAARLPPVRVVSRGNVPSRHHTVGAALEADTGGLFEGALVTDGLRARARLVMFGGVLAWLVLP